MSIEVNLSSGLLAVHEAAMQPPPGVKWTPDWMMANAPSRPQAATPRAAVPSASAAPPITLTRPLAAPVAPGAVPASMSEAERLAAIEALRLPGTDAAIESAKADRSMTPSKAALLVMAAYKTAMNKDIPNATSVGSAKVVIPQPAAEWAASPPLQAEFASAEVYTNYQQGVATGRCRVYAPGLASGQPLAKVNLALLPAQARAEWAASPSLQAEFASADIYVNYRHGVATGRCRILGRA